jgi:hypothetical protein
LPTCAGSRSSDLSLVDGAEFALVSQFATHCIATSRPEELQRSLVQAEHEEREGQTGINQPVEEPLSPSLIR